MKYRRTLGILVNTFILLSLLYKCNGTITCKVLLNWPHSKVGHYTHIAVTPSRWAMVIKSGYSHISEPCLEPHSRASPRQHHLSVGPNTGRNPGRRQIPKKLKWQQNGDATLSIFKIGSLYWVLGPWAYSHLYSSTHIFISFFFFSFR